MVGIFSTLVSFLTDVFVGVLVLLIAKRIDSRLERRKEKKAPPTTE